MSCDDAGPIGPTIEQLDSSLVRVGKDIFRFDTFGDEKYWTDTLRMQEVIQSGVSPATALSVGLKVDVDSLPAAVQAAIAAGQVDLNSPATTVTLLKLNAVVGLKGQVTSVGGHDSSRASASRARCVTPPSTNSFAPGIGHRRDGWPNTTLNPGAIVALSPAVSPALKTILNRGDRASTTRASTSMARTRRSSFPPHMGCRVSKRRLIRRKGPSPIGMPMSRSRRCMHRAASAIRDLVSASRRIPDLVTSKLPALRQYQLSLSVPRPTPSDAAATTRGKVVFDGVGRCATCHTGSLYTDINSGRLHAPSETGMDPRYAARTSQKAYRTTPLRGLLQHAPYFHDGSAASLAAVVDHYDSFLSLGLTAAQKQDLIAYLQTL